MIDLTESELVRWAIQELRDLDEACRALITGFAPMDSTEMFNIKNLGILATKLESQEGEKNDS